MAVDLLKILNREPVAPSELNLRDVFADLNRLVALERDVATLVPSDRGRLERLVRRHSIEQFGIALFSSKVRDQAVIAVGPELIGQRWIVEISDMYEPKHKSGLVDSAAI